MLGVVFIFLNDLSVLKVAVHNLVEVIKSMSTSWILNMQEECLYEAEVYLCALEVF